MARRHKGEERALAASRIARLLDLARNDRQFAPRYARIATELAQKHQTGLPPSGIGGVCRACKAFLGPGSIRMRVRPSSGGAPRLVATCLVCAAIRRRPLGTRRDAVPSGPAPSSPRGPGGPGPSSQSIAHPRPGDRP